MIELHAWPTPNAHKISIFLEEAALPYRVIPVDIGKGDQFRPDFLAISPNNRMPAIVDLEGPGGTPISVFESGAILMYLGDKTGLFFPKEPRARVATTEWLMWQMGGVGPMFGQLSHFAVYAREKLPYAIERYTNESQRLVGVLNRKLATGDYVAGDYSIADMAIFPWVRGLATRAPEIVEGADHVKAWVARLEARPAVKKGLDLMSEARRPGPFTDEERKNLFERKA
ncbi:glutathione S-transferase N-terminal domain-containing protein [soil metagenome]